MTTETRHDVRYITNAQGEKTDILIPLATWEVLLQQWKRLAEALEDQEDCATLQAFMRKRAAGEVQAISIDDLERELIADGLLPG